MDDLAVPLQAADGNELMEVAARTLRAVHLGMRRMGLEINLSRGKTELMPIFHGKGSKQARHRWLIEEGASLRVELATGCQTRISMTGHYVHLGARLDVTGSDVRTVHYRACLMREMVKPLSRLLRSPELTESEKVDMVTSMPHARLRHGSGCWQLATERERARYQAAHYEAPRRLFRHITALSTQGASDEDVALILGIPRAQEARNADVLRQLGWILLARQPRLQQLWMDSAWGPVAREAMGQVVSQLGIPFEVAWKQLCQDPSVAGRWARRYLKTCIQQRQPAQASRRAEMTAMQAAREAGAIFCRRRQEPPPLPIGHSCDSCGEVFQTKAAMAAHARKIHGITAPATQVALGTSCAVCMKEFWTHERLKMHLRKAPDCVSVLTEAEMVAEEHPHRKDSSPQWLPATKLVVPQPWWAGLRPVATTPILPAPAMVWQPYLRRFLQCIRSDKSRLAQTVREIVEHRVFATMGDEELPLSIASLPAYYRDLLCLLVLVGSQTPAPSAATIFVGAWSASLLDERVVIRPVVFADWDKLKQRLPKEWSELE